MEKVLRVEDGKYVGGQMVDQIVLTTTFYNANGNSEADFTLPTGFNSNNTLILGTLSRVGSNTITRHLLDGRVDIPDNSNQASWVIPSTTSYVGFTAKLVICKM